MMFGGKQVVVCGYGEVMFNLLLVGCLKCILLKCCRVLCVDGSIPCTMLDGNT
jgi:hypothetical protein